MADDYESKSGHRTPHSPAITSPFLEYDLARELRQLHEEPSWTNGQNAKTLVKYDEFRVVSLKKNKLNDNQVSKMGV